MSQPSDTAPPTTVDLATAAVQLGLSLAALRKRIQRGQIPAMKVDGKLRVVVDNTGDLSQGQRTVEGDKGQRLSLRSEVPQLVMMLQDEVVFLRGQVTARNAEVQQLVAALEAERAERQQLTETAERAQTELRQLLAQAHELHRVALLPAPMDSPEVELDTAPANPETVQRSHWWQFWKRSSWTAEHV